MEISSIDMSRINFNNKFSATLFSVDTKVSDKEELEKNISCTEWDRL